MKFVLENNQKIQIQGYDQGQIAVAGLSPGTPQLPAEVLSEWKADDGLVIIQTSCLLSSDGKVSAWDPDSLAALCPEHLQPLAGQDAEVVLIGTGAQLRFPSPECIRVLQEQKRGYEIMDTAAACRTFNVLVAEGRRVVLAALMID